MKLTLVFRHALLSIAFAFGAWSVPAVRAAELLAAPLTANTQAGTAAPDADDGPDASGVQGNVAELKQMVQAGRLTELRITYNGSYGASLFFYPDEMVYYVALFQDKRFWRVVKTQDDARAETVYAQFARKSYSLADAEIQRTRLQAQKALLERVIAVSNDRAKRLASDLAIAQAQDSQVSQRQQQMQAESTALQNDKTAAEHKLRALQQQVEQLQNENEAGLPPLRPGSR
jgi:Protein of unknown function (DUF2968)